MTSPMTHDMMHMVMHVMKANDRSLKPITVRIPEEEYGRLKKYAAARDISLNSVVAEAIAQYEARVERREAISRIHAFQRRLRDAHKQGSDSVELLRRIREARANRQIPDDETFAGREEAGNRGPGAGTSGSSSSSSGSGSGSGSGSASGSRSRSRSHSWSGNGRGGGRRKP